MPHLCNTMHKSFNYFNKDTNCYETVEPERWQWRVIYKDGSKLDQFDEVANTFHRFSEIDQKNVFLFQMLKKVEGEESGDPLTIFIEPGSKLFHFYRRIKRTNESEFLLTFYIFGYQVNRHKVFYMITPNDQLIISENEKALNMLL